MRYRGIEYYANQTMVELLKGLGVRRCCADHGDCNYARCLELVGADCNLALVGLQCHVPVGAKFMQFLYFASGSDLFYFASAGACWKDWQRLTESLEVLAYP